MATWAEFATGTAGTAAIATPATGGERAPWQPLEGGAAQLAAAGERLFDRGEIALLATVSRGGRPRIHPFVPKIVDGRLWAFIIEQSPKRHDLDRGGQYTIHAMPGDEDEEFWVSGRARLAGDSELRTLISDAMPYDVNERELLYEFDLTLAGWTTWEHFQRPGMRPVHRSWVAP